MNDNKFCLDLWGGDHCFNLTDRTYYLSRTCGLFSNLTIMIYGIVKFTLNGYIPEKLSIKLLEYDTTSDYYKDLFKMNESQFTLDDIDQNVLDYFMRLCEPNLLGLGRSKNHLNFDILNRVNKKYFSLSDDVINNIKDIENKHNIDYNNTVFIWARKTDKVTEISIPEVDTYIKLIYDLDLKDKDIFIQTDDIRVYDEFVTKGLKCKSLNEIPYSKDYNRGFHNNLQNMSEYNFYSDYNMTKKEYLQKLLSLTHIASKCNTVIVYPGNLCTYIPIIRESWNNVYSFKDKNNLLE